MHSEEEIKLELSVSGKKAVKASDITKNSQVEIINPELVLANITDPAGNLNMEIYIQPGRGYQMSEGDKKASNEIGFIEVDAVFSPILAVSSNVENVRVGKMTNWDKLIINIKTDGTITYEEAFKESVQILIDQFNALLSGPEVKEEVELEAEEEAVVEKIKEVKEKKPKKLKNKFI